MKNTLLKYRQMSSSEDSDTEDNMPQFTSYRSQWVDAHYDVLEELYHQFRDNGKRVFGDAFFQLGNFGSFIDYVRANTVPDDLLKPVSGRHNVSAMGSCAGG